MKAIAIDISRNSSPQKVKAFLNYNSDADIIYAFDYQYYEYESAEDLLFDMNHSAVEFFSRPCAYYDMATAILANVISMDLNTVIIYSPGKDECSRLSNRDMFNNYVLHFNQKHPRILTLDYSYFRPALLPTVHTGNLSSIRDLLRLEDEPADDGSEEEYDDSDFLPPSSSLMGYLAWLFR